VPANGTLELKGESLISPVNVSKLEQTPADSETALRDVQAAVESEEANTAKADQRMEKLGPNGTETDFKLSPAPDETAANVPESEEAKQANMDRPIEIPGLGGTKIASELNPPSEEAAASIPKSDEPIKKDDILTPNASADHSEVPETKPPMVPEVRKVNFECFKNYTTDGDDNYVIDALVAGANLVHDVQRVHILRKWYNMKKPKDRKPFIFRPSFSGMGENTWIHRIRIQSPSLIFHLAKVVGEAWSTSNPRTFFRPFRVFIYFQPRMKEVLEKLEAKWKGKEESHSKETGSKDADVSPNMTEATVAQKKIDTDAQNGPDADDPGADDDDFYSGATQNPAMYDVDTL
jgi:hypothetical protein